MPYQLRHGCGGVVGADIDRGVFIDEVSILIGEYNIPPNEINHILCQHLLALKVCRQALIDAGAVQCGFCIPGIVMELYALFEKEPDATEDRIQRALNRHLCRCTGYEAIWEGALLAQERMKSKVEKRGGQT